MCLLKTLPTACEVKSAPLSPWPPRSPMICRKPVSTSSSSASCRPYSTRLPSQTPSCTLSVAHMHCPCCASCPLHLSVIVSIGQTLPHVSRLVFLGHLHLSTTTTVGNPEMNIEGARTSVSLPSLAIHCTTTGHWYLGGAHNTCLQCPTPFSHLFPLLLSPFPPAPNYHHLNTHGRRRTHPSLRLSFHFQRHDVKKGGSHG